MRKNSLAAPVVKWFGDKHRLLDELAPLFPKKITSYCEPFLGSGTVLFFLQPGAASLCDANPELVAMYETVRDQVEDVISVLSGYPNQENYYRLIRNWDRDKRQYGKLNRVQRAARMIYLSRTCYNGLYRENSLGEFDTPFGHYRKVNIVDAPALRAASDYLRRAKTTFYCGDYAKALTGLTEGSFVYFDPPYDITSDKRPVSSRPFIRNYNTSADLPTDSDPDTLSAAFPGKNRNTTSAFQSRKTPNMAASNPRRGFDRSEQIRLRRCCDELNRRGIRFMLSNLATDFILEQYREYHITRLKTKYPDAGNTSGHGAADEIVIRNYS